MSIGWRKSCELCLVHVSLGSESGLFSKTVLFTKIVKEKQLS